MSAEAYASVALLSGPPTLLTYCVPPALTTVTAVGCVVIAPLQSRLCAGVVVGWTQDVPVRLRDLHSVVDQKPVLDSHRMALAKWIASEYHTPLGRACGLMVPPGYTPKSAYVYSLPAGAPGSPQPALMLVLDLLRTRGPMLEGKLLDALRRRGLRGQRDILRRAVEQGQLQRESTVEPPRARATRSTLVQLTLSPHTLEIVMSGLAAKPTPHAQRRLAALRYVQAKNGLAWADWLMAETQATRADLVWLQDQDHVQLGDAERWRDPLSDVDYVPRDFPALTQDQDNAWRAIAADMQRTDGQPRTGYLLRGVTGSGKTEVYMRAVKQALELGQGALILVPEISLTPQTARRFLERFPGKVALIHSKLRPGERFDTWRRIRDGELPVVVGARSALFAPLPKVGVIVLDEEHDASYKQDRAPTYDARRVAEYLAAQHGASLILGSATPSMEAMHAYRGAQFLELPNRVRSHALRVQSQSDRLGVNPVAHAESETVSYQPLPDVQVIDMREELQAGNAGMFSVDLKTALGETLARGEQALLFLNRRGLASCVMCRDCGLPVRCPNDEVPLAVHLSETGAGRGLGRPFPLLRCHQCDHQEPAPAVCPNCGSARIKFVGIGTQRIEEEVRRLHPTARVVRWDRDAASQRGAAEQLLNRFVNRQADVLVGTQMVAKGLDLPMVTLVGVVLADVGLFLPDFRATERGFGLSEQVAGRAGRSLLRGRVLLQTYNPDHPAITFAEHHDVAGFAAYELAQRKLLDLPPFVRLVKFEFVDDTEEAARAACTVLAAQLRLRIADPAGLIGPAQAYFARRGKQFRWQVIARCAQPSVLLDGLTIPANCSVDVDPMSLL